MKLLIAIISVATLTSCVPSGLYSGFNNSSPPIVSLNNQTLKSAYNCGFNLLRMNGNARSDFQRECVNRYVDGINDELIC